MIRFFASLLTTDLMSKCNPRSGNEKGSVENKRLIYERLDFLINLLVTHDMSNINEHFYELTEIIENSEFGVEWSEYDSLTTRNKGVA